MHGGRGHLEVALDVGFGRWLAVDLGVEVDEGEVLTCASVKRLPVGPT